jgi:hypothetical protein
VVRRIAEEDARDGAAIQLVTRCGLCVRIREAPEDAQHAVVRGDTEEQLMGRVRRGGAARPAIEEEGGGAESFGPELGWHRGMEQQRAHAIIQSAKDALGLAILLASVGTREAHDSAMARQKRVHGGVIKLTAVVYLQRKDWALKLRLNISIKCSEKGGNFRFVAHGKCPGIVRVIVEND